MKVQASKVRKGQRVHIEGVLVEVTKREKWNSAKVKIHYKDCGNGLPYRQGLQRVMLPNVEALFFNLTDELEVDEGLESED